MMQSPPASIAVLSGWLDRDRYTLILNLDHGIRIFNADYCSKFTFNCKIQMRILQRKLFKQLLLAFWNMTLFILKNKVTCNLKSQVLTKQQGGDK